MRHLARLGGVNPISVSNRRHVSSAPTMTAEQGDWKGVPGFLLIMNSPNLATIGISDI